MPIELDTDIVRPGDVLAIDYAIAADNATLERWAIRRTKEEVAKHPMLDYQSSKTQAVFNVQTEKNVTMLRIWAKVRKTEKVTEMPVQEASLGWWAGFAVAAVLAFAATVAYENVAKWTGYTVLPSISDVVTFEDGGRLGVVILCLLVYFLFLRK